MGLALSHKELYLTCRFYPLHLRLQISIVVPQTFLQVEHHFKMLIRHLVGEYFNPFKHKWIANIQIVSNFTTGTNVLRKSTP